MSQTVDWAIQKAFSLAQRKAQPPLAGTSKYAILLSLADTMQKMWAAEPETEWDSLYSLLNVGTITTTDSYTLPSTINYISSSEADPIRLVSPDGTQTKEYRLVKASQLYRHRNENVCAQIGQTLKFNRPFTSTDTVIGYSIMVPSFIYTNDITAGTNQIQVDDPMWLAYMMAADFCRNDVVKMGQYNNLLSYASQSMDRMKDANSGQMEQVELGSSWMQGESWV